MPKDTLLALYFYANCTIAFFRPDLMVVKRNLKLKGRYDFVDPRKIRISEDTVSCFFDFVALKNRIPTPDELLTISLLPL